MKLFQALKEAISSINSNRTRSLLTILGIVIGVGAVIALMAIGQGAQQTITGQIESIAEPDLCDGREYDRGRHEPTRPEHAGC